MRLGDRWRGWQWRRREGSRRVAGVSGPSCDYDLGGMWLPPARCHCGRPVTYGFDGDPTHHRGMCLDCDEVRCDAHPDECPWRFRFTEEVRS